MSPRRPRRRRLVAGAAIALALTLGTGEWHERATPARPLPAPSGANTVWLVACPLPSVLAHVAYHPWFLIDAGDRWERWEVWQTAGGPWGHVRRDMFKGSREPALFPIPEYPWPVFVLGRWTGDEARRLRETLRNQAPRYRHRQIYLPWPGPNSNTFVAAMLRQAGLTCDLPAQCVGKDYPADGPLDGPAAGGVGFETALAGAAFGPSSGLEVHALGTTFGVDVWPPALKHPLGRLGWPEAEAALLDTSTAGLQATAARPVRTESR